MQKELLAARQTKSQTEDDEGSDKENASPSIDAKYKTKILPSDNSRTPKNNLNVNGTSHFTFGRNEESSIVLSSQTKQIKDDISVSENIPPKKRRIQKLKLGQKIKYNNRYCERENRIRRQCLRELYSDSRLNVIKSIATSDSAVQTTVTKRLSNSTENSVVRSNPISVIVKQEQSENENNVLLQTAQTLMSDHNVKISSKDVLRREEEEITSNASPSPRDKAETNKLDEASLSVHNGVCFNVVKNMQKDISEETFNNQMCITDVRLLQNMVDNKEESRDRSETTSLTDNQSMRYSLGNDFTPELNTSDSHCNDQKSKDRTFGKISELISDEQKEAIEMCYRKDMSAVNSEEVEKNLTVIDKKNIKCNICGFLYPRMDKCQVHIWGHLNIKPYKCKACDYATVTVSNVRCHIRKTHLKLKPFACHLCEKRFVTAVLLEEHINVHTGARPFKCTICDFTSASRQVLSYHNTTHKPVKDIICKICSKQFYSRNRLRAHMVMHNKDKFVMCKLCSAYLSNINALKIHHKNIHMRDYVCNVCGKHLKSKKSLNNHQNVHAAAKYKCTLCHNAYKSRNILKEHLLKHEGIRKYKCEVCGKTFAQRSHLAAHMAVHSEVRFHCPGCNKAFNRQDNMKIHTRRCKVFLANPELQNLLPKREKNQSFNKVRKLSLTPEDVDASSNSMTAFENNTEYATVKTAVDDKTGDSIESELQTTFSKSAQREVVDDIAVPNVQEFIGSREINLESEKTVRENILHLECF